jgi:osmoprotectant transport system substrate-binding protein
MGGAALERGVIMRKKLAGILGLLSLLLTAGCSGPRPLTVGSKNFTEQIILGEIAAQQLERRLHLKVDRKLDLGGTLLAQQALQSGAIDLYPEYTGTALTAVLKLPPVSDPAATLERVRAEYRKRWNLEWLDPLGFNNTFAMVVRGPQARAESLETLSDAARRKQGWRLGVGYEFLQRPDGLPGLLQTYRLPLDGNPKSMDLGLLYSALEQKQVDMAAANATDGMLSVLDVKILRDDKSYFPPYQAALIVRQQSLTAYPGLRAALDQLASKLSDADMRKLNYQVDGKHRPVAEVARELLSNSVN